MARMLIVEDEPLIALAIEDALADAGHEVVGTAGTVAVALDLIRVHAIDGAILDINLGSENSDSVAVALSRQDTPFVTLTGYTSKQRSPAFANAKLIQKPFHPADLLAAVSSMISERAASKTEERTLSR